MARAPRKSPLNRLKIDMEAEARAAVDAPEEAERPEVRGEIREEDPRTRAARRAAEIMEHGSLSAGAHDKFHVDASVVPPGWTYEWKFFSTLNKEDESKAMELRRNGWEPVPASRHPDLMPNGSQSASIIREGMILMERPKEITDYVRRRELDDARQLQRLPHELGTQTPTGTFERSNKARSLVDIKRSYGELLSVPRT